MEKLTKALPKASGVYFFKDQFHHIIYIGKAKSIKDRVKSYFNKVNDFKTDLILSEYADIDFIVTESETEALLLEAQLIKEHQPKYNVLLKDGQPFAYILFTTPKKKEPSPTIKIARNKKEKGTYFGPFLAKREARSVVRYLMHTFALNVCNKKIANGCLDYHLGRCAGSCKEAFDHNDYLFRFELAKSALKNNRRQCIADIKTKMAEYNAQFAFEKTARLYRYLQDIDAIFVTLRTKYHEHKYHDAVFATATPMPHADQTEVGPLIAQLLSLDMPIKTIDCFDISHFQSKALVGSCVRFTGGVPEKNKFRRFKINTLTQQNDYAALQEIVARRYREGDIPDLILIDGGKGQLSAAKAVMPDARIISLAKREETVFSDRHPHGIKLDQHDPAARLLIALRDYAHHFAVSYHKVKRKQAALT